MAELAPLRIDLRADATQISAAAERVAGYGAAVGLDPLGCFQVQVIVAEALNNIVYHGYPGGSAGSLRIRCAVADTGLEIRIYDAGLPLSGPPNHRFPEGAAEGGRGWPIMVNWADRIEYHVSPGHNELTLTKSLS